MKKILLTILLYSIGHLAYSQSDYYDVLTGGSTSGNGRAPQGARGASRSVWLISSAEMTASGLVSGDIINSLGFNYSTAQDIATTGTITIYLENTTDTTNGKSTTWATAISGMTTVSSSSVTIPAATGIFNISFSGGSTFTYTGGALYVAFDYQNFSNPLATTANVALCNTSLTGGLKGAMSAAGATTAPTTIAASNFRPYTILGKSVSCSRPQGLSAGNETLTSCDLSWTSSSSNFELEYGLYGFTQGSGTTVTLTNTSTTVNSLSASTVYQYYVRSDCGSGNYSEWGGPYAFHTLFQPTDPTYNTGFEQEDLPFIGWVATPNNTTDAWFVFIASATGNALVQEGVASAVSVTPSTTNATASMISRGINLQAGSNVEITYYDRNYVSGSTGVASYTLTVGTAQDVASQTTVLNTVTNLSSTTYTLKTVNFTPSTTGTYYFAFNNNSPANAAGTHALFIDNFTVTETLSANEFKISNVSLSPNPTKNMLYISNDNTTFNSIEVSDLNGRIVKATKQNALNTTEVNISDLSAGVYMVKIVSDKGTVTKKVIKE